MSIIIPVGNRPNWVTAGDELKDDLLDAAKAVVSAAEGDGACEDEGKAEDGVKKTSDDDLGDESAVPEVAEGEAAPVEEGGDEGAVEIEVADDAAEPTEDAVADFAEGGDVEADEVEIECDIVEQVEEAVAKIDEAVSDLKGAVQEGGAEAVIEVGDKHDELGGVGDVGGRYRGDVGGVADMGGEEAEIDVPGVVEDDGIGKEGMEACAGSKDEFVKYAKLSPKNRAKLQNYWVNMLGYPKDYVALMTKNYEK